MRWTCAICGVSTVGTAGVLGVEARNAKSGQWTCWAAVHPDCFDDAGWPYGVDFEDIRDRGLDFWLEHIGGKAWAANTDYWRAFTDVARRLGGVA